MLENQMSKDSGVVDLSFVEEKVDKTITVLVQNETKILKEDFEKVQNFLNTLSN